MNERATPKPSPRTPWRTQRPRRRAPGPPCQVGIDSGRKARRVAPKFSKGRLRSVTNGAPGDYAKDAGFARFDLGLEDKLAGVRADAHPVSPRVARWWYRGRTAWDEDEKERANEHAWAHGPRTGYTKFGRYEGDRVAGAGFGAKPHQNQIGPPTRSVPRSGTRSPAGLLVGGTKERQG